MAADDRIKPMVVNALVKDGWTITDDPYRIVVGTDQMYVDLAAERAVVAAERGVEKIAVEVKSFLGSSPLTEFYGALGQFVTYHAALRELDPDRRLVVAVGEHVYEDVLQRPAVRLAVADARVPFPVVRLTTEEIVRWTD